MDNKITNKDVANKAIVLLSGGLDSATVLRLVAIQGYEIYALSFSYGQKHSIELEMAKKLASAEVAVREHKILNVDLKPLGGSSLTDDQMSIPKAQTTAGHTTIGQSVAPTGVDVNSINRTETHIPNTYVPARNTIFLSYAMAYAEVRRANHIFIGANAIDYSGYPDCRPAYLKAFEKMANLGSVMGVAGDAIHIQAPLLYLNKKQIIQLGSAIMVDYQNTSSCYDPGIIINADGSPIVKACGRCDSCRFRLKGFADNGMTDKVEYKTEA